jgi:CubicO group peptidase (beta-lactamase class C family)
VPLDNDFTFYLMVKARPDGSIGAFLRNPERNSGYMQYPVDRLERAGDSVRLFAANKANSAGRLLAKGTYDAEREVLSIYIANRGGSYDFSRVGPGETSDFYPRGRPSVRYVYAPPPAFDDGWPTGSLESAGISRDSIERFIQMIIDRPGDSLLASEVHAVLIARHGKLVLEEYFHGESREKPHDTRSAAKSLTATLIGAAMQAGVSLKVSTPVYEAMNGGTFPPGLEPRKRAITLEHLLTMSSGLDCDDSDPKSLGREDYVTDESGETDYYKYTMALKMIREPGEKSVYGSMSPNLAGGVLKQASGRSLPDLMYELIAQPLQMKHYYIGLTPTGDAYMGGGARFLPRDFMKLGQLHLNGGTWNGHRVVSEDWCRRATSYLVTISSRKYGYLWWVEDYPYRGRTLRVFFAAGNGGQIVLGIPDLDMVIAFYGGNYSDPDLFIPQREYVPKYILPAVDSER